MSIQHNLVTRAWLAELEMSQDEDRTEQERKTYFAKAMFDEAIYRKSLNEFHEEGGFGYVATSYYLNKYVEITELQRFQSLASNKKLLDPNVFVISAPEGDEKGETTIFICKDKENHYVPLMADREIHWNICDKLNKNPSKYDLQQVPLSRLPALQILLSYEGKSEKVSRDFIRWLESNNTSLEAILCQNISNIVETMKTSVDTDLRDIGHATYHIYLDPAFRKQGPKDIPTKRLSEFLGISKSHLMRLKKRCVTTVSQSLFPVPLDRTTKMSALAFSDSNEIYSKNLSEAEVNQIMGGFRFKYILEKQILDIKRLVEKGAIPEEEFLLSRINLDESSEFLEQIQDEILNIEAQLSAMTTPDSALIEKLDDYKTKRAAVVEDMLGVSMRDKRINNVALTVNQLHELLKLDSDVDFVLPKNGEVANYLIDDIDDAIMRLHQMKESLKSKI